MLSTGVPMLLMGDEVRRTQKGNNNAFCQDNKISWFDWDLVRQNSDLLRFVKRLIALQMNRSLPSSRLDMSLTELRRRQPVQWHGVKLNQPDWGYTSHTLAGTVQLMGYPLVMHLIVNAYWEPLEFEVPPLDNPQEQWRRCIDTYQESPNDFQDWSEAPILQGQTCRVEPRSLVLLFAMATSGQVLA